MKADFVDLITEIHARGWTPGTGGNFSFVEQEDPLLLCITPSGLEKGSIRAEDLLTVDDAGVVQGVGKASAETLLHVEIAKAYSARVILHTHTVWNTIASMHGYKFVIEGFEMLKALEGNSTHEHREVVPILGNSQDMFELSAKVRQMAVQHPAAHGFLLKGHGLYTWGKDLHSAQRHLEALEFLFEVALRLGPHSN